MIEDTLDLKTRAGAMETFICHPERAAAPSLVVFLMDASGIPRQELYDMARRPASVGYCVALPNLYYRSGEDTHFSDDVLVHGSEAHTRMRAARKQMTLPSVMNDMAGHPGLCRRSGVHQEGSGRRAGATA
ncbi:MAG: dienelactone hydrolase family protein [Hyphomicrobiaceae bacterium]